MSMKFFTHRNCKKINAMVNNDVWQSIEKFAILILLACKMKSEMIFSFIFAIRIQI